MARIKIPLLSKWLFSTVLSVRINDINYGAHLSNDAVLRLLHEARLRFLHSFGYSEMDIEGVGIIMSDCAITYQKEAFWGDKLQIRIGVDAIERTSCDLYYQIVFAETEQEVARAKTQVVFFNYTKRKIALMPQEFKTKLIAL